MLTNKRSYDFVCDSADEAVEWVLGLEHLCEPPATRQSKGKLLFRRARMRLQRNAKQNGQTVEQALAACFRGDVDEGESKAASR